jgi:aryl-alcohol dehydrogenase-like predicted oxidoreductase
MTKRGNRDELVLVRKYSNIFDPSKKIKVNYKGDGTKSMRLSIERSLHNLQTTYIDLFYVHIWDFTTSIPESMHSLVTWFHLAR